MVDIQNPHE
jgi:hypothetical protein